MPPFGMILSALSLVPSRFCSWAHLKRPYTIKRWNLYLWTITYIHSQTIWHCTTYPFLIGTNDWHNYPSFWASTSSLATLPVEYRFWYHLLRPVPLFSMILSTLCLVPTRFCSWIYPKSPHTIRRWFLYLWTLTYIYSLMMWDSTTDPFPCRDWWLSQFCLLRF